jgi:beta-N-acetylhexosaminidase
MTRAASVERGPAGADAILGSVLLAFDGTELPDRIAHRLASAPAAGVTLFRSLNVRDAGQVRELTEAIRRSAIGPMLIAADQEGGQLLALGDAATPFAGNMAVGAAGDAGLAERVGHAIGLELRALGVNVAFAPVCDVATNPANPALGIRSFGDDPTRVARLAAATARGLASAGVAATAKHFPGLGDLGFDSHHELATAADGLGLERFDEIELVPFRAAIEAGVGLVMSAHVATPGITGDPTLPATLAQAVMTDLLRDRLGFDGLSVTDALDMAALTQGPAQIIDIVAAVRAGVDLLLTTADDEARERIETGLVLAARRGLIESASIAATGRRLAAVHARLGGSAADPDSSLVGAPTHRSLAAELAERSVTLVRNDDRVVPIRLPADALVGIVQPEPADLTPADTSSNVGATLAPAIAERHPRVDSYVTASSPTDAEISALRDWAGGHDLLIVGTISASLDPAQATLVRELAATGVPLVAVALRTPWDLAAYPHVPTYVCSYGILPPSMDALAAALWGATSFRGRLPVTLTGLYPRGHGLQT